MQAATVPAPIRVQALGVIAQRLGGPVSIQKELAEAGTEAARGVLADLEQAFAVTLDAREVWPDMSLAALACLVETKVADKARLGLLPRGPAEVLPFPIPAEPEPWTERKPLFPGRTARELRDAVRLHGRRRALRVVVELPLLIGAYGGFVAYLLTRSA